MKHFSLEYRHDHNLNHFQARILDALEQNGGWGGYIRTLETNPRVVFLRVPTYRDEIAFSDNGTKIGVSIGWDLSATAGSPQEAVQIAKDHLREHVVPRYNADLQELFGL